MDLQIGILISFIMYLQLFFRPIRMIADRFNTLQMGVVSSSRIFKLLASSEHIANEGSFSPEKVQGNVKLDQVWFAYKEEDYVLKDISFEVKKGQTIALVGATGAGKSSIINLISRFYEINKGTITIDGTNIQEFELSALRKHIGVVLQDVFLFSSSIYQNITLGNPNITKEQVLAAAELVGASKFIEKLPGGLDYNVMERGATLSVGQRQLISFVRAMVYNPEILILDEATSSVDSETEELIQESIEKMMQGRTSIVIAHRLSTIQKADQILVLNKGEIVERGTHESLLEHGGYYTQLNQMQRKMATL
jgi:ATP-binding cassette subfamily B protein